MSFVGHGMTLSGGLQAPRTSQSILSRRNVRLIENVSEYARTASVVIAMALHNQAATIRASLTSALAQTLSSGHCAVVILDDQSTDEWRHKVEDLLLHPAVVILNGRCGSAAAARNAILDFVEASLPRARWVARLDPDDLLCSSSSIEALRSAGDQRDAKYVIGSNYLCRQGAPVHSANIADPAILLDREQLATFIHDFCTGHAGNELPSCNLLVRTGEGIRYPLLRSAEDHWLVAQLLMFRPEQAAVISYPVYCCYTLAGAATSSNQRSGEHRTARKRLADATKAWLAAIANGGEILGSGMEGCVWRKDGTVTKLFYPNALSDKEMSRLVDYARASKGRLPRFQWSRGSNGVLWCSYKWSMLSPVGVRIPAGEVQAFLLDLAHAGVVAWNIKRDNLRLDAGRLMYIDIGKDVRPFAPAAFIDSAARLYAIGILGLPDGELARRPSCLWQHEALAELEGFADFYRNLVELLHPLAQTGPDAPISSGRAEEVTLLIKACPQDHASLVEQVTHIVCQLSRPQAFAKVVLAIDPHIGNYLRQYDHGDLESLLHGARSLQAAAVIDAVLIAPREVSSIEDLFRRWFGVSGIGATHTASGAPVFSQLWAFEQIRTRYVLQADLDVLIGKRDDEHDYLSEMLTALRDDATWCVGFNIPKREQGFRPYASGSGGYVPEIRLGLLDLDKIKSRLPLPNTVSNGRIVQMWHRSMQQAQAHTGMQTVRGGDVRTFYVHPQNQVKSDTRLDLMRDLISQGMYPPEQAEEWDLVCDAPWRYPTRSESVVFLLKGRDTPTAKLRRCLQSLLAQTDQEFGIILIDDASAPRNAWSIASHLGGTLRERTTLVRRRVHHGYIRNFLLASELCTAPGTLIAVLDQDDVLMSKETVASLKRARNEGADLINCLMFRPNKPLHLYLADYENSRAKGGGNTWTHLRAFTKGLFDSVPEPEYMHDGDWIADVSDYATMLPMAELARKPVQLDDQYYVWHDRPDYSADRKRRQAILISMLLSRPALAQKLGKYELIILQ